MVLVESRKRRVEWLTHAAAELGLENCRVIGARLESVESLPAAVITARAFAPLGKLLEFVRPLFHTATRSGCCRKGGPRRKNWPSSRKAIQAMFHVEQSRTDPAGGILVGKGTPELR